MWELMVNRQHERLTYQLESAVPSRSNVLSHVSSLDSELELSRSSSSGTLGGVKYPGAHGRSKTVSRKSCAAVQEGGLHGSRGSLRHTKTNKTLESALPSDVLACPGSGLISLHQVDSINRPVYSRSPCPQCPASIDLFRFSGDASQSVIIHSTFLVFPSRPQCSFTMCTIFQISSFSQ